MRRHGITKDWSLGAIIISVIVIVSAVGIYLIEVRPQGPSWTVTAPSLPGYNAIATDTNSAIGIDLVLGLNSTTVRQGHELQNVIEVLNFLPRVNNVSVASNFPIRPYQAKCLPGDSTPVDVELYQGRYDRTNISAAKQLPYIRSCPIPENGSMAREKYYSFAPNSPNATLYGVTSDGKPVDTGPISLLMTNSFSLGSFGLSFDPTNGKLPLGEYTILVEDFWGQMVLLNIAVVV